MSNKKYSNISQMHLVRLWGDISAPDPKSVVDRLHEPLYSPGASGLHSDIL